MPFGLCTRMLVQTYVKVLTGVETSVIFATLVDMCGYELWLYTDRYLQPRRSRALLKLPLQYTIILYFTVCLLFCAQKIGL